MTLNVTADAIADLRRAYEQKEREDADAWRRGKDSTVEDKRLRSGVQRDPGGRVLSTWQEEETDHSDDASARVVSDAGSDPRSPHFNLDTARAARDAAYEAYDRKQKNAWRKQG